MKNLILSVSLIILLVSCAGNNKKKQKEEKATKVEYVIPTVENNNEIISSGQLQSKEIANIGTRIMGYIRKINVQKGNNVQKGQLLVSVNDSELQAKLSQVEFMLDEANEVLKIAKKNNARFSRMLADKTVSQKEYENVNLHYVSMKSKVKVAEQMKKEVLANMSYTQIRSPFDGIVASLKADEGMLANPGQTIIVVEKLNAMVIQTQISESHINSVVLGTEAKIYVDAVDEYFKAVVTEKSRSSINTGGQYKLTLIFKDLNLDKFKNRLLSGMHANVIFNLPKNNLKSNNINTLSLLLPSQTIIHKGGLDGVFVISENNQAILKWVRLGRTQGNVVEILSGVSLNDKIIIPNIRLKNGMSVSYN